jgi:hypothetical protein
MKKERNGIVLLAGGIKRMNNGLCRSTYFNEESDCGPPGSYLRTLATAHLFKVYPESIIIASGGRGTCNDILAKDESLSAILKRELLELEIPEENIVEESGSNTTYENLIEINKLVPKLGFQHVLIVSNRWHLARINEIIKHFHNLHALGKISEIVSAEDVVVKYDPLQESSIKKAYHSEPILRIIKQEKNGVLQIKANTYKF